jgi:hypothetical protein
MKSTVHSFLALSFLVIPSVRSQDRPERIAPPHQDARPAHPERLEAQRREHERARHAAPPERREGGAVAPSGPARPLTPPNRWSDEIKHESRIVMERMERMARAMEERDARLGKVARELNARIDRLEAIARKPAPAHGSGEGKKDSDEKGRQMSKDAEEQMKRVKETHLKEIEAKTAERARELHEMAEKLGKRERELQQMAEKLGNRERELRQMEERIKQGAGKMEAREKHLREMEMKLRKDKEATRGKDGE